MIILDATTGLALPPSRLSWEAPSAAVVSGSEAWSRSSRHQIKELSLFGSAARGEIRPDSDFDFLVDFLPGARPGLLGVSAMQRELTTLLGRRVHLAVKPSLKPLVRPAVLAEARLIYHRHYHHGDVAGLRTASEAVEHLPAVGRFGQISRPDRTDGAGRACHRA